MSPAVAFDIRSPLISKHHSSLQNPNSKPINVQNDSQPIVSAPVFGNANEIDMSKNGWQTGSTVSGRARPRLVKVRRQFRGRSRGASTAEFGSASSFNPFKSVKDDCGQVSDCRSSRVSNAGFVFGASASVKIGNLDLHLNSNVRLDSREREFGGTVRELSEKGRNLDSTVENPELGNAGFMFGASGNNEKEELNCRGVNVGEVKSEKVSNVGDNEFCGYRNELESNLNSNKVDSSENGVTLGSDDVGWSFEFDPNTDCFSGRVGVAGSGFEFRDSLFDAKLKTNEGNGESGGSPGDSVFAETAKFKVGNESELQKRKGDGKTNFVRYSSSEKSSSLNKCLFTNYPVEVKSSSKSSLNCSIPKDQSGNLGSIVNDKLASLANSSNVTNISGLKPVSNLLQEMEKLNLKEFINADRAGKKNLSANGDTFFVFGSSKKASASCNGSSDSSTSEWTRMGTDGDKFEPSDKNIRSSTASASSGISSSESFTFQARSTRSYVEGQFPRDQVNGDSQQSRAAPQTPFSSVGIDSLVNGEVFKAKTMGGVGKENEESSSTCAPGGLGMPLTDFKTSWDPSCLKTSLFPELNKKQEFTVNNRLKKGKRSEIRLKLKQHSFRKQHGEQDHVQNGRHGQKILESQQDRVQKERSDQENPESPGCYSPMDFSPYEQTMEAEKFPEETFVTSNDSNHQNNDSILHATVFSSETSDINKDRELNQDGSVYDSEKRFTGDYISKQFIFGAQKACSGFNIEQGGSSDTGATSAEDSHGLDINKDDNTSIEMNQESSGCGLKTCLMGDYFSKGFVFGAQTVCSGNIEQVNNSDSGAASAEDKYKLHRESSPEMQFSFASGLEDIEAKKFSFSASTSVQTSSSTPKRLYRKKYRNKPPCKPFVVSPNPNGQEDLSNLQRKVGHKSEINELAKQGSTLSAVQEACETWRARGNHAYQNGDMLKAEVFYTYGINSIPASEMSGCCLKPLVICYSNRAAAQMSLGNIREALRDCAAAVALDPNFFKVQLRSANCHLQLGEIEDAVHYFSKCLESGAGVCLDRKITIEAADGLQKAQKVADCTNNYAKFLEQRTYGAAVGALDVIAEALSISPYSERLLEMKAGFLFMLGKYEEVIQLCEHTLCAAEKNFPPIHADGQSVDIGCSESKTCSFARLWRWHLISKSYFYLGNLEMARDLLEKLEQMGSVDYRYENASKILELSDTLAVNIRDLLHQKSAGNEAVRSGRYTEAVEHYTAALLNNIESRPFAAICFGNRAAAHQALDQIAAAIADCSVAIALDRNYSKAVSRRAALHEMIRDYGQAANDLQRLASILENQSDDKAIQSSKSGRSTSKAKELRQARQHLSLMEDEAKKGVQLDLYRILGVKDSDTASDIKKAYRKAALKHHPDKAGQFLSRTESGDDGLLWKEILQEVHTDADRLFKMIGEAYAVLSDPTKRSEYDFDEGIRKASKEHKGSTPRRRTSYTHSNSYERNDYHRNCQDNWKTYGYSRSRW